MGYAHQVAPPRATRREIAEAMDAARPLAAQLRAALRKRESLGPAPMLHVAAAVRDTIGSLRADIRSVANRAYIDDGALTCLLDEEDRLRATYRRKPTFEQIQKAVGRRMGDDERAERAAHDELTAAQKRVKVTTAARCASGAAGQLLGIGA